MVSTKSLRFRWNGFVAFMSGLPIAALMQGLHKFVPDKGTWQSCISQCIISHIFFYEWCFESYMHWSISKREHKFFPLLSHWEICKAQKRKMCPCMYVFSLHASSNATWQIFPKRRILQQLSICSKSTYCAFCIANEIPDQIHAYAWKVQECNYHTCCVAIN